MRSFFLVGPMGSGKTSVGRQLARKLSYKFFDSDREIEERCGVDIPTIFEYEGEQGFREREEAVLEELTTKSGIVLATGGGSILRESNRQRLSSRGYVILLSVEIKEQLRRVALNNSRPLLHTEDPEQRLRDIMQQRAPFYQSVANVEISTDSSRMQNVVNKIMRHIKTNQLTDSHANETNNQSGKD